MNAATYGGSPAAATLVEILKARGDKKLISKVSSCIHDFYIGLREIKKTNMQHTLLCMWQDRIEKRIQNGFDSEIANFMRNVITAECRKQRIK